MTDPITITGTHFLGASGVEFNGTDVIEFTVDSDTQITARVPPGATSGPVGVTTPAGVVTSAQSFNVLPPTPVTNDEPEHAIDITAPWWQIDPIVQDTQTAQPSEGVSPSCVPGFGRGVWYRYDCPNSGDTHFLSINTEGSTFDTGLAIYCADSNGALVQALCDDDSATYGRSDILDVWVPAGQTVYILAGGKNGAAGFLRFNAWVDSEPPGGIDIGNMNIQTGWYSASDNIVDISIGGTEPNTQNGYGQIGLPQPGVISPNVALYVNLEPPFTPWPGSTFDIIVAPGSIEGDFGSKHLPSVTGLSTGMQF